MAKKKKRNSRKPKVVIKERSSFWPLSWAIILVVLATFMLLGGFGTGGVLPKNLFHGTYWALGWTAYLAPIALVYFGVIKFKSEDRKIPLGKFVSMLAALGFTASWFHAMFANKDTVPGAFSGGHGGSVGRVAGNVVLSVLDKWPASLMFFVFAILSYFFAFGISPRVLAKLLVIFERRERDDNDTDLAALKQKAGETSFKLNEGVPVEHHAPAARLTNMKNTAEKLTATENHQALTTTNDVDWKFPGVDLLNQQQDKADAGNVEGNADIIKETFANFNIDVEMEGANVGPRVTQFTLKPPAGVKLAKIAALDNNLSLDLAAESIRIEAPIPGKRAVGIEVPNVKSATVRLASILGSKEWNSLDSPLGFALGRDISGIPVVGALDKMPHMLIAGQTNSGKSVMVNTFLISLLYRNSPSDLKLILVDPKHVELSTYNDIPHLLTEVITEPEKCISALKWAVAEMERRYRTLAEAKQRNIAEYNALKKDEGMPYIVIVIDELADLMMMAARDVEALIVRIAQKARAVGIHLVLATQSPRVTVITGLIKANIPARIAFTVAQEVESRIILDQSGAEKLLGQGDMLFSTSSMPKPKRVQGALIMGDEIQKVTDFLRMQRAPQYDDEVVSQPVQIGKGGVVTEMDTDDEPLFRDAVRVVIEAGKASTSLLQRRLRIGYGKAARMIENMEEQGIVGPADGSRPREVLVSSLDEVFGGGRVGVAPDVPGEPDIYDEMDNEQG
jgi:S-DNA-T family DNA segregation ATPase FtsK/SpoIIIE